MEGELIRNELKFDIKKFPLVFCDLNISLQYQKFVLTCRELIQKNFIYSKS